MKRLTTKTFIEKAQIVHEDKYDYSLSEYIHSEINVKIICKKHGIFMQRSYHHLHGAGCPNCIGRNKTTEEFIKELKKIHKDRYDYSMVDYRGVFKKIKIICKLHGIFEQTANNHLKGTNCPQCGMADRSKSKSSNTKDFIVKAKKVHGDKYDYSLVEYKNAKIKIKIICSQHGIFEQLPSNHLQGTDCGLCVKNYKIETKEFIEKAIKIHGNKYDYSSVKYINSRSDVKIICKKHGVFHQLSNNHLQGNGCPRCVGKNQTTENFIREANKMHLNEYDYSPTNYMYSDKKVKIICREHGVFEQTPQHHLGGAGCPNCKFSKGEKIIEKILIKNNIKFESQKKFNNCLYKRSLPFDKYCPDISMAIEYDGQQHYFGWRNDKESLYNIKIKDEIKNKFCKENGIKLIRIPYWEYGNIEKILTEELGLGKNYDG